MEDYEYIEEKIKKMDRVGLETCKELIKENQKKNNPVLDIYLIGFSMKVEDREAELALEEENFENKVSFITNLEELERYENELLSKMNFLCRTASTSRDRFDSVFSNRKEELMKELEKLRRERSLCRKIKDFFIEIDMELLLSFLLLISLDLGTAYFVNFFFPKLKHDEIMTPFSFVVWFVVSLFSFFVVVINGGGLKDIRNVFACCSLPPFLSFAGFAVLYKYPNIPFETVIFCFSFGILIIPCCILICFFYLCLFD